MKVHVNNAVITLTGESGDGIISLGEIMTKVLARMGLNVLTFRTYPAEVRGGQCVFAINSQQDAVYSQGDQYDILFCMDSTAYTLNGRYLRSAGVLIYNSESLPQESVREVSYGIPIKSLTTTAGIARSKNAFVLGVIAKLFHLDMEKVKSVIFDKWGKNKETMQRNLQALMAGHDWAATNLIKKDGYRF